jgi:hypothetical protein
MNFRKTPEVTLIRGNVYYCIGAIRMRKRGVQQVNSPTCNFCVSLFSEGVGRDTCEMQQIVRATKATPWKSPFAQQCGSGNGCS